jgi:hypothetical protein
MLYGGLCELAKTIARAEDQDQAQREALEELRRIFDALAQPW